MRVIIFLLASSFLANIIHAQDKNKLFGYFQDQQFDEAINYLLPLSIQDSGNIQLLGYLGYAYNMSGNAKATAKYYERILTIDSLNISANQNLADIHFMRNPDVTQALTLRLIRLQPQKAVHYRSMGNILDRKKEKDSALLYYELAYNLSPDDPKNAAALADILIDLKSYPKADSILSIGLAKDSMYVPFLTSSIRSAYENENYEQTLIPGERLMNLEEVTLKPLTQVILSYYMLNRYTDCIRVCDYLRSQEINVEGVNYYEAKAWAKLKDYNKSNELLRICLETAISKTAELYYYAMADNYEGLGKYTMAVSHYDTAFYLFKDPLMKYNSGRIYETKLKNPGLANKYFKNYLTLADTSTPDEKKIYRYLHGRYGNKKTSASGK
jgi:tetratricopeptide (TPR) repeat protein